MENGRIVEAGFDLTSNGCTCNVTPLISNTNLLTELCPIAFSCKKSILFLPKALGILENTSRLRAWHFDDKGIRKKCRLLLSENIHPACTYHLS